MVQWLLGVSVRQAGRLGQTSLDKSITIKPETNGPGMIVATSERLRLRKAELDDADLFLKILNDPDFVRFVGDRGVRNLEQARRYLRDKGLGSFEEHGFGPYVVEEIQAGQALGLCTLVKRENLEGPDIGFAFLPEYRGKGYAMEASSALLKYAEKELHLKNVCAIVAAENRASISLLKKLGLRREKQIHLSPKSDPVELFVRNRPNEFDYR